MKKICSGLLALVIFVNSIFISIKYFPTDVMASSLSMEYYNILSSMVSVFGISNAENNGDFTGVVYAKVADFDKNGTDELYILSLPYGENQYKEQLYEGETLVYENQMFGPGSGLSGDLSLSIGEGSQGVSLNQFGGSTEGGYEVGLDTLYHGYSNYYGFKNGEVQTVNSATNVYSYDMISLSEYFKNPSTSGDMPITEKSPEIYNNWDGVSENYVDTEYFINNSAVSESEYNKQLKPYSNIQWEKIIVGSAGMNEPVIDSKKIVNNTISQLVEQSKPTNIGENIYDAMDSEIKSSMVEWLMDSTYFVNGYKINTTLNDQQLSEYVQWLNGTQRKEFVVDIERLESSYTSDSSEIINTRIKSDVLDEFLSVYLGQSFSPENFTLTVSSTGMDIQKKDGYYNLSQFSPLSVEPYKVPFLNGVYEISEDIYYIDFIDYDLNSAPIISVENYREIHPSKIFDSITEEELNNLYSSRGYAVMKKSVIDGEIKWTLIERNTSGETFDESLVEKYKKQDFEPLQINFLYEDLYTYSTLEEYIKVIEDEISAKTLNNQDKLLLNQYISTVLQKLNMQSIEASQNEVTITNDALKNITNALITTNEAFNNSIEIDKLSLNKSIEHTARFNVDRLNTKKPIKVQLSEDLLKDIDIEKQGDNNLYISFDGSSMGVSLTYKDLQTILSENGATTLILTYSEDGVTLTFENKAGEISKLSVPITVIVPAKSEASIVYTDDELWGGQYIAETNSLFFETKNSGTYSVKDNVINLSDIDTFTEEQKEQINFLVTRGFFDIENEKFEPSKTITRNEFVKTINRMFFLLDKDAVTSFTDVQTDSPYYHYISSAEEQGVVYGYKDNTFKGDILVPITQVLSISARTLATKKGYEYPTNPEEYLNFIDADKIPTEARAEIALAVREGLIEEGGLLEPQRQITRAEAAEILYKLYMLLYEQPIYVVKAEVKSKQPFIIEHIYPILGVSVGAGALGFVYWRKRKISIQ